MRTIRLVTMTLLSILLMSCGSNNGDSIPKEFRGPDGVYHGSAPANLTVVISNGGTQWHASGTLPWDEQTTFNGYIKSNGDMISSSSETKCGKIYVFDDYVSSVTFLNYPVYRDGEKEWREKRAKMEEQENKRISEAFMKKLNGESVFFCDRGDYTVYLEFDPNESKYFYEYVVKNNVITSKVKLKFDSEYLGSGVLLDFGTIKAKSGRVLYKPEEGKSISFLPAGSRLENLKIKDIPEQFKWILGEWMCWSDNKLFYEILPEGEFVYQHCNNYGEITDNHTGTYLIQKVDKDSISLLFSDPEKGMTTGVIEIKNNKFVAQDGNSLRIARNNVDTTYYFKFSEWLNNVWTDGEQTFTIKNNKLSDPHYVIRKHSFGGGYDLANSLDWSLELGVNIIYLTAFSSANKKAILFVDRFNKRLAIEDEGEHIVSKWFHPVKHYSSPLEVLQLVYPTSNEGQEDFIYNQIVTERFDLYTVECDYDPLLQTQDSYTYVDNPNPVFTKYPSIENAYLVEWKRYEDQPNEKLIVVFTQEDGGWKIDNIVEFSGDKPDDHMRFDYSRPPEPAYDEEAYPKAVLDKIEKLRESLSDNN